MGKQDRALRTLSVNTSGVSMEFEGLKEIPKGELNKRQDELEKQLQALKEKSNDDGAPVVNNVQEASPVQNYQTQQAAVANVNGYWNSDDGSTYTINQFGSEITIQQSSPLYGVVAVGQGNISGNTIHISFTTALYTQGTGRLQIDAGGQQIFGSFTDSASGFTSNARLFR